MAERTPRFAYHNLFAAAVLTALSENVAFPLARLRTPFAGDRWRSVGGFIVRTGWNDKLDFNRGGVKVATIAAGVYRTGKDMAAAVKTALEAADPGAGWNCGYYDPENPPGDHFFISRSSGFFDLLFGTGANKATSIHRDMSFPDSDVIGVEVAEGGLAYQSRQWVVFDLGSAQPVTVLAALGVSPTATITMQANSADAWASPAFSQVLSGTTRRVAFIASQSYRYWRLLIEDVGVSRFFSEAGIVWGGTYFQPARSFRQGFAEMADDLSVMVQGDAGSFFSDRRGDRQQVQATFPRLSRADRLAFDAMLGTVGTGGHLLFALDPQNEPVSETLYGVVPEALAYRHQPGDVDRYDVSLRFVEERN